MIIIALLSIHFVFCLIVSVRVYKNLMLTNSEKLKLILLAVLLPIIGAIVSFSLSTGGEFGSPPRSSEFYGNSSGSHDSSSSGGD